MSRKILRNTAIYGSRDAVCPECTYDQSKELLDCFAIQLKLMSRLQKDDDFNIKTFAKYSKCHVIQFAR